MMYARGLVGPNDNNITREGVWVQGVGVGKGGDGGRGCDNTAWDGGRGAAGAARADVAGCVATTMSLQQCRLRIRANRWDTVCLAYATRL